MARLPPFDYTRTAFHMTFDERLRSVFSSVFGIEPTRLLETDSSQTIAEWDSLSHLNLIFALESEFDVRFDAEEIPALVSVNALRLRIAKALDAAEYV